VLDKKAPFSRLAKSGNPQFTYVNEEFPDKRNAENGVFLPTLTGKPHFAQSGDRPVGDYAISGFIRDSRKGYMVDYNMGIYPVP
jgi:hypothetical protein